MKQKVNKKNKNKINCEQASGQSGREARNDHAKEVNAVVIGSRLTAKPGERFSPRLRAGEKRRSRVSSLFRAAVCEPEERRSPPCEPSPSTRRNRRTEGGTAREKPVGTRARALPAEEWGKALPPPPRRRASGGSGRARAAPAPPTSEHGAPRRDTSGRDTPLGRQTRPRLQLGR